MPKAKSSRRTSTSTAPTKRSSPRASVQASSAAVRAVPARSKRSPQVEAIAVASDPAVPTHSNEPVQSMLSPQFMETLITRVADEVSRRLSPAEVSSNPSPAALSTLQEVPVSSLLARILRKLRPQLFNRAWLMLRLPWRVWSPKFQHPTQCQVGCFNPWA